MSTSKRLHLRCGSILIFVEKNTNLREKILPGFVAAENSLLTTNPNHILPATSSITPTGIHVAANSGIAWLLS
jgi:hypothetical protein